MSVRQPGAHAARPGPAIAAARPLGLAGRLLVGGLVVAGLVVGAPSVLGLAWFVPYAGVGALLAIRRPRTSIGWILMAIGWALALASLSVDATAAQFGAGSVGPITAAVAMFGAVAGVVGFYLFGALAIVFPSGDLPTGRWRLLAQLALVVGLVAIVMAFLMPIISVNLVGASQSVAVPNPLAFLPWLPIWQAVDPNTVILPTVVVMVVAAGSLVVRFRHASGVERQQYRWITAALAFVVLAVLAGFAVANLVPGTSESGVAWLGALVAYPCVPIAVGIAVLRYRLYEIDRIISRTIGWLLVSLILAAVFVALILGLQTVLAPVTRSNTLAVAASTLVAAALFQPLRRRVQRAVDRRFNRSRVDAERASAAFAGHVRDEVDVVLLREALIAMASDAVRPADAAVWLRPSAGRHA